MRNARPAILLPVRRHRPGGGRGGESIGGQAATHYTAEVDLESARETIPEDQAEVLEDVIATLRVGGISRQLESETWVGEDGLVQRVQFTYALGAPMELAIPDEAEVVPIEDVSP